MKEDNVFQSIILTSYLPLSIPHFPQKFKYFHYCFRLFFQRFHLLQIFLLTMRKIKIGEPGRKQFFFSYQGIFRRSITAMALISRVLILLKITLKRGKPVIFPAGSSSPFSLTKRKEVSLKNQSFAHLLHYNQNMGRESGFRCPSREEVVGLRVFLNKKRPYLRYSVERIMLFRRYDLESQRIQWACFILPENQGRQPQHYLWENHAQDKNSEVNHYKRNH